MRKIKKVPSKKFCTCNLTVYINHDSTDIIHGDNVKNDVVFHGGETYAVPEDFKNLVTVYNSYSEVDYVDDPLDGEF